MAFKLTAEQDQLFSYQIGSVKTDSPWWRPTYERICSFLKDEEVSSILDKYHACIAGGCLWDFDTTWDVDIHLQPYDYYEEGKIDWYDLERDINRLNDIALNQWKILLDVSFRPQPHVLPSKFDILNYNEGRSIEEFRYPTDSPWLVKIGYCKKQIGDSISEVQIGENENGGKELLTDGYLCKVKIGSHNAKIINKILNSENGYVSSSMPYKTFIELGEDEFKINQNKLANTDDTTEQE